MPDSNERLKTALPKKPEKADTLSEFRKTAAGYLPAWLNAFNEPNRVRWAVLIATALVIAFLIAPKSSTMYEMRLGEPAPETIVSPITFKVIDKEADQKNREEVLKSVRPVYDFDDEMVHEVQAKIARGFTAMTDYLNQEAEFRAREDERTREAGATEAHGTPQKSFRAVDDEKLRERFGNELGFTVPRPAFETLKSMGFNSRIQRDLTSLVVPALSRGVVQSRELLLRDGRQGILVKAKSKEKLEPFKDLSVIFDLNEALLFIESDENDSTRDPALSRTIRNMARDLVNVNITYNREKSTTLKNEALVGVKPVYFQLAKGEPIIQEGEPVNEGHIRKLEGLNNANPAYRRYVILIGIAFLIAMLLRLTGYFAEKHLHRERYILNDLVLMCMLLLGIVLMMRGVNTLSSMITFTSRGAHEWSLLYAAPVAIGSMLVALLLDARPAFLFAPLAAMIATLTVEGDVYLCVFYFISGIVGLHGAARINDRRAVMRAGLVVGLVNMLSIAAVQAALGRIAGITDLYEVSLGFLGGVLAGLLVSGFAPILELLGYTTNIKLLELANFNHPLLKELSQEAPGTYHHSIMVGNLAESAAELIGANSLLAKVGALYHDIGKVGKTTKPGYFIENQGKASNPHEKLEPSMSALILISHVKNGVEKARDHSLGDPIIDIIQQHHGTSLIKFFYVKALEKSERTHQPVTEDKYHYPGPRPQSKEAALVMLADVAEAACRTLADPTPDRIQKRVQTLIMTVFSEGQLDQSTLTLKDLHAITRSFVRGLQGILHQRIVYPEKDAQDRNQDRHNGDTHRQPTELDRIRSGDSEDDQPTNIRRLGL